MNAYYNEIEPFAAQWLRNLIAAGHIADGEVDERSIVDVSADDLVGFRQVHFFAGIGGWSLALRLAGWPDDRPVWTGSCPCQPFSVAGQGKGEADARHLWPEMGRLVAAARPVTVMGEQVDAGVRMGWLDAVFADLERGGYACRAADLPAAGFGAPHIRQRIWWRADRLADRDDAGLEGRDGVSERADQFVVGPGGLVGGLEHGASDGRIERRAEPSRRGSAGGRASGGLAEPMHAERRPISLDGQDGRDGQDSGREEARSDTGARGEVHGLAEHCRTGSCCHNPNQCDGNDCWLARQGLDWPARGLADADGGDARAEGLQRGGEHGRQSEDGGALRWADSGARHDDAAGIPRPGPTNSFWRDADWLGCRDGKWRPVEPCTFPLADGLPGRVGRLRAYGNAISPQVAAAFIEASEARQCA